MMNNQLLKSYSNVKTADEILDIKSRHPEVFSRTFMKRFAAPLVLLALVLYTLYAAWFFSFVKVMREGNWDIAGTYLADWVSYEIRPDIDYRTGEIKVKFPRFSPLGEDPDPDWIKTETGQVTLYSAKETDTSVNSKPAATGTFMSPTSPATSDGSDQSEFSFMSPNSSATSTGDQPGKEEDALTDPPVVKQGITEASVRFSSSQRVIVTPTNVTVFNGDEIAKIDVDPISDTVEPVGALPDWATQKTPSEKIFVSFGFGGRIEIRSKEVKVSRRFLGWENFFFDTYSPFWGKSFSQVVNLALVGERVDPDRSNIAVMADNFLNNAEWQHGDVWIKLLQTIVMAFVGTLFAVIVAFPLAFFAARNITPNRLVNQILKRFFDFFRSVDMLIWALFFTRAFGPGPLAGISAIFLTDTGTFGKLYSEALENIDDKQREGVKSVGAPNAAVQRFGVIPQVLPVFASQALYFWESNTRSAIIIGAVGAGGIGLKLWEAMRTNQDWENVFYMVILILMVVFIFDNISNALRQRLMGRQG